jgi:hypothetical protein
MTLSVLECSGVAPPPLCCHTLSPVGNRLYMFGGAFSPVVYSNNLYVFETGTFEQQ